MSILRPSVGTEIWAFTASFLSSHPFNAFLLAIQARTVRRRFSRSISPTFGNCLTPLFIIPTRIPSALFYTAVTVSAGLACYFYVDHSPY
nr:MAG TPA: hypothetical protein [Caudoviricetes sp.]